MSSRQLTFDESKTLKKYMSMSTDELVRDLNISVLPKASSDNIDDILRGRFFLRSDIQTFTDPRIVSSRTKLLLSQTKQLLQSNQGFIDSLEKLLAQRPTDEELITFVYDFLETHGDRRRSQMRIVTYICRAGIKAFLEGA